MENANFIDNAFEHLFLSNLGSFIATLIAIMVVMFPLVKWFHKEYLKNKSKKEKKENQEREKELDDIKFKTEIRGIIDDIPKLDDKIQSLCNEINSLNETNDFVKNKISEIEDNISHIKEESASEDSTISNNLVQTQELIKSLSETTQKMEEKMDIVMEEGKNEFKMYLMELNTTYVHDKKPISRETKQHLRIKYEMYKKKGGNGWAEDLYNEIMQIPVERDDN